MWPRCRPGGAAGANLPLHTHMIAHRHSNSAQVSIRGCQAIAMIDSNPQAKRTIMIEGIVPACSCHHTGCRAEHRLKPQIEVVAIMAIVTADATRTVDNRVAAPPLAIKAHKEAIGHIPGLIVIDKRYCARQNRLRPIVGTMQEGRGHASHEATESSIRGR